MNESERHGGVLKSTEHYASDFFEFGGRKLHLKGTSGPPKELSRMAEGMPIRHDASAKEQNIHQSGDFFEFGGRQLHRRGTSGPPKELSRMAEGVPIRHEVSTADHSISARTSDSAQLERSGGEGRPAQEKPEPQFSNTGLTGGGQLIGDPVRRA